ncbi:MAG: nucleoside:proton symporter [bacterium]|nr:nucleoside:proton symporter [bacterium]
MEIAENLQSFGGLTVFPLLAWLMCSRDDRLAPVDAVKLVILGVGLQFLIAGAFLLIPQLTFVFDLLASAVSSLQDATKQGMVLVFGYLAGGPAPFEMTNPQNGFVLATQALPLILLVSVLSKLLYHFGILQRVVGFFAWCLEKTLGVSGALGTAAAANIFVGMVEAPLLVRPYIATMSKGALFATMTVGMATVAGTVLALYASILELKVPGAAGHILVASVMSAPAAIIIARLMVPWAENETASSIKVRDLEHQPSQSSSAMEAIADGASDGLKLLAYVISMLIVMVSLIALLNMALAVIPLPAGAKLTVEGIFGWLAAPLAWLTGIPWNEALAAGELIGIKTVLNEFLAYLKLAEFPQEALSERSRTILIYALCGFANPGSLGIMTGGLIAMAPERRADIIALGPRSLIAGTLATLMTGAVIGTMK